MLSDLSKLSESQLIHSLFGDVQVYANAFHFVESAAIGSRRADWQFEVYVERPRTELGLSPSKKPGDVDILMIPVFQGDRFAERSTAIEVKKVYLPNDNRGKSPNTLGVSQSKGLLNDGFPLVALMHFPLIEASITEDWQPVPVLGNESQHDQSLETQAYVHVDHEAISTFRRIDGRMAKLAIPEEIGLHSLAHMLTTSKERFYGFSLSEFRSPTKNRETKSDLVEKLRGLTLEADYTVCYETAGITIISSPRAIAARNKLGI